MKIYLEWATSNFVLIIMPPSKTDLKTLQQKTQVVFAMIEKGLKTIGKNSD